MPRLDNTVVAIAQIAQQSEPVLQDFHFENCTIVGPAVLVPIRDVDFTGCTFEGPPEAIFWEIPPEREVIIGAIGLVGCSFVNCQITGVGIAGPAEFVAEFKSQVVDASATESRLTAS